MKSKTVGIFLILSLMLSLTIMTTGTVAASSAFQAGGDRLVDLQNNDGGWDWPLDDGDPNNASPTNTAGPIGMGLAQAYLMTGDADHLTALGNVKSFLLAKTNNFSPSDGYLAVILDSILGGTDCLDHVTTNFYDELAAGTYNRNGAGTLYDTAGYVLMIRTARANQGIGNLAAWDIGMGLVAASMAGADTTAWVAGVKAEIDELDGSAYYDVIGLAGAVYGLAIVGEDFDPTAGEHAAAGNLVDLADILVGYQLSTGGFTWNSDYVVEGDDNETVQETAYATLALREIGGYGLQTNNAVSYLLSVQLATGGWKNWAGGEENNEVTGEALWAISSPTVVSCDAAGNEVNVFAPGQTVYVKGSGFVPGSYNVWIQPDGIAEGPMNSSNDPSGAQESVTADSAGNIPITAIWDIPSTEPPTNDVWDIIIDNCDGIYSSADDGIDDASVAGFIAPVPELPTVVLFGIGLLGIVGYWGYRKSRSRQTQTC